jgi:opacity protein-like surface antigen
MTGFLTTHNNAAISERRRLLKKTLAAVVLTLLIGAVAEAQDFPKVEVLGGYSLARIGSSTSNLSAIGNSIGLMNVETSNLQKRGFETSGTFNLNQYLGIECDFRWNQGTILKGTIPNAGTVNANLRNIAFLSGPRFAVRRSKTITPFAHALFGGNITTVSANGAVSGSGIGVSASTSNTGYAIVLGGGLDVSVNRVMAIRLGQLDYVRTHTFRTNMDNLGVSFGVSLRFGGK